MLEKKQWSLLVVGVMAAFVCACSTSGAAQIVDHRPAPVVATNSDGTQVRSYGNLDVLDVAPDLQPDNEMQLGNKNPKTKIQPKKSWEIGDNFFGATPPRVPRSIQTDRQFYLPINLIDGNPKTYWVSRGQPQPNIEPEWIRLDFPQQRVIEEIVLYPRAEPLPERGVNASWGPTARYYNPMPKKLTIRVSIDGWHWDTVYATSDLVAPAQMGEPMHFRFPRRRVKQVWIVGEMFDLMVTGPFTDFWGHCWTLGEVQALDEKGRNWALTTFGTGVTTSSTNYGYQGKRDELADWWSLHYDLGLKWLRVAFWTSVLQWHYVEQEKGKYVIDPDADKTITEAKDYGVKVVMGLEYGNWLYTDTPKDNFAARLETMPFDPPPVPWSSEQVEGYKNFVRFMVRHFKGRVYAWELWNEPLQDRRYGWGNTEEGFRKYAETIQAIVPIIREEDPNAKIMASGTLGKMIDLVAPMVDIIDIIRYYETSLGSPAYVNEPEEVARYKQFVRGKGFKGDLFFSQENQWWGLDAPYPDSRVWSNKVETDEMGQAKNLARTMTRHAALGLVGFWNETWNTALTSGDVGLLRHGFDSGPSHNVTVRPAYYVYRTLCTVLADAKPDPQVKIELSTESANEYGAAIATPITHASELFDAWGFRAADGSYLVAIWAKGEARDNHGGSVVDVHINLPAHKVMGFDTLNGVQQEMNFTQKGGATEVSRVRVYDYPTVLRGQ